jgi:hypothetical protein
MTLPYLAVNLRGSNFPPAVACREAQPRSPTAHCMSGRQQAAIDLQSTHRLGAPSGNVPLLTMLSVSGSRNYEVRFALSVTARPDKASGDAFESLRICVAKRRMCGVSRNFPGNIASSAMYCTRNEVFFFFYFSKVRRLMRVSDTIERHF